MNNIILHHHLSKWLHQECKVTIVALNTKMFTQVVHTVALNTKMFTQVVHTVALNTKMFTQVVHLTQHKIYTPASAYPNSAVVTEADHRKIPLVQKHFREQTWVAVIRNTLKCTVGNLHRPSKTFHFSVTSQMKTCKQCYRETSVFKTIVPQ